jgi:hypothetical protein
MQVQRLAHRVEARHDLGLDSDAVVGARRREEAPVAAVRREAASGEPGAARRGAGERRPLGRGRLRLQHGQPVLDLPQPRPRRGGEATIRLEAAPQDRLHGSVEETVETPSQLIDKRIAELGDWRGEKLARLRALVKEADPEVVEEWKWRGVPCWYHDGLICTGETYKQVVKVTFAKGASLEDPARLFNSSLEGNIRRAIDFHEDDEIDEQAFKALIRAAVELNSR